MHDRSDYLDGDNQVLHYAPVLHTARTGGVTSLFWGRYTPHLPVGYRAGFEPLRPPTWQPQEWTVAQLRAATHVLVTFPDDEDVDERHEAVARLEQLRSSLLREVARNSRGALYEVAR
jgi:hypothetical protein